MSDTDELVARLRETWRDGNEAINAKIDRSRPWCGTVFETNNNNLADSLVALTFGRDIEECLARAKMAAAAPDLWAKNQALQADLDRTERNRDMWKGQCERQAEELARLRTLGEGMAVVVYEFAYQGSDEIEEARTALAAWNEGAANG